MREEEGVKGSELEAHCCVSVGMRQAFGPHRFERGAMPNPFEAIRCLFEPMPNPFAAMRHAKGDHRP
jgi:hypothetical protein